MSGQSYSPIPFADVTMTGPFWRERLDTVLSRTIPSQHAKLEETGILGSLKLPKPIPPLTIPRNKHNFTMQLFWDSDVGKWIEAASYALSHRRDAEIEAKIDAIIEDLARAQSPDGYLNCWYNGREPEKRWQSSSSTAGKRQQSCREGRAFRRVRRDRVKTGCISGHADASAKSSTGNRAEAHAPPTAQQAGA